MRSISACLLLLIALLLWPATAPAQTAPAAETKSAVVIKADFVLIKTSTLDDSRFHFDLVPLKVADNQPALPQEPVTLQYAAGYPATRLYQEMQKTTPMAAFTRRNVSAPVVSTPNDIPVTITVNEEVTDFDTVNMVSGVPGFLPQVQRRIRVTGSFTLTPHINANHSITLQYSLPPGLTTQEASPRHFVQLPPIANRATLVISGLYTPMPPGVYLSAATLLRLHFWTLLIFITPTIATKAAASNKPLYPLALKR